MPKVLISDAMDDIAEKILLSNNIKVDVITNFTPDELNQNIISYDGLIVRSATKVNKEVIENAKNLKVVGRAGAGVDNIDIKAAKQKNIIVMNTPGGNTNATAEHTLALLLSLSRKISKADINVSVTGIAGPNGGTKNKPVGLVFIGVKKSNKLVIFKNLFKSKSRNFIQKATVKKTLKIINSLI